MAASGAVAGRYTGAIAPAFHSPALAERLASLPELLAAPAARLITTGRNRNLRIELEVAGRTVPVMVKAFGRQAWPKDWRDARRGSKAQRTYEAAAHLCARGAGTPEPIAYLERWQGGRLRESYYLAEYQEGAETLRDALLRLFDEVPPQSTRFVGLLECVAEGMRRMHDAGFLHHDLGNQNILVVPGGEARWRDFMVVDLNRGRIRGALGPRERARDFSRLELPSDLLHMLIEMYWRGIPPRELLDWQRAYRWLYGLHARSRRWRHPLRHWRHARSGAPPARDYPAPRDVWIWDAPTAQPIAALLHRDRARLHPLGSLARNVADALRAAPGVWRAHRALRPEAYAHPVALAGRVGMALEPTPQTLEQELALLSGLGPIPALLRFYHHDDPRAVDFRAALARRLHDAGHPVSIALVQDRRALRAPASWHAFLLGVLERVAQFAESAEIGHAVNRVKWGVWGIDDLRALYAPLPDVRRRYPHLQLTGPAMMDFEYAALFSALREWPRAAPLAALSHCLYVDRRGAPENPQHGFGSPEKFVLGRAMARAAAGTERFVVSEVNWPLRGQGAHAPIHAPYFPPWRAGGDTGVTEQEYGAFLLRYLCLALGSGMVERVYWWRLAARGYGLVDDTDPSALRPRVAYAMLQRFLALLGEATFVGAQLPAPEGERHGRYRFDFRRTDGESVALTYAHGPALEGPAHAEDALGRPLPAGAPLGGAPVYLRGARA
ncbi:MAG: lipopolysaccharide kinase InaA family protein [Betaproteobacteria bacterium]|nr:lipopolysaccharide kinase InaA family protein [Betaproteobacteria bacterium]MDH5350652.1 lipopolysaccharide kinase InaA family protein [Betaproteobacteria bacterium]